VSNSKKAHIESIVQNVFGVFLAQIVLHCFNVPLTNAIWISTVIFFLSYIRTYLIRRLFQWMCGEGNN